MIRIYGFVGSKLLFWEGYRFAEFVFLKIEERVADSAEQRLNEDCERVVL